MNTSFLELRAKQVVNIVDGRVLGHIVDMIFDTSTSRILGFVVPGGKGLFSLFKSEEVFVPYSNICKIGDDTILVKLINLPRNRRERRSKILGQDTKVQSVGKDISDEFEPQNIPDDDTKYNI